MKNPKNWLTAIVGFSIGAAVLTAIFATGGPFDGLMAIAEGTCTYGPAESTGWTTAPSTPATLDRSITVRSGTALTERAASYVEDEDPAVTAKAWTLEVNGTEYLLAVGATNPLGDCDSSTSSATAAADWAAAAGNVPVTYNAALSGSFYAPIITAVFVAVPLGVLGMAGMALYNSNFGTKARGYVKQRKVHRRRKRSPSRRPRQAVRANAARRNLLQRLLLLRMLGRR